MNDISKDKSNETTYKDLNGKTISVGDVVKYKDGAIGVVYYDFFLNACLIGNVPPSHGVGILMDMCNEVEKI